MKVKGKHYYTIWKHPEKDTVIQIIDQRYLPFEFIIVDLKTLEDVFFAIKNMLVRGAPLIGVTAAYGMYLALLNYINKNNINDYLVKSANYLKSSRPTAINLQYTIDLQLRALINNNKTFEEKVHLSLKTADEIYDKELYNSKKIGENGLEIIKGLAEKKQDKTVNILTHCNAGWLACVDYGTATAPIYLAHDKGIKVHVWVDETRPRNQGARLTVWELQQHGVPCTLIADNAGGHLMQQKMVDMVIVGSDRTTINGDVANKIGTYLKALAAYDNNIPFYVALPTTTIDWNIYDGLKEIPIEERDETEMKYMEGLGKHGMENFLITTEDCHVSNFGFDVTPANMVTALITELGICKANKKDIKQLINYKKE